MMNSTNPGVNISTSITDFRNKVFPAQIVEEELGGLIDELVELIDGWCNYWGIPTYRSWGQGAAGGNMLGLRLVLGLERVE
jgi:hypothetical protein